MYSLLIMLMALGARLAALFNHKIALMVNGHRNTWRRLRQLRGTDEYVWFHAA